MKKLKALAGLAVMAGLVLVTSGCDTLSDESCTGRLWCNTQLHHYQPASRPDVNMFQSRAGDDVLVVYLEQREKTGAVKRRAYFPLANEDRVQELKKPRFVALRSARGLEAIPVETSGSINLSAPVWAELTPDADGFRLFRNGVASGWYHFPVYRDRRDDAVRILLTPVAVTADVAVVGMVVGIIGGVIYLEAEGDNCGSYNHCYASNSRHSH